MPCIVAPGVWLVVLPDNQRGAELYPVLFRDRDDAPVNPGLPADWLRVPATDRDVPWPACLSCEWEIVTAAWEGTGARRTARWGYGPSGAGRAFVCRVCGYEGRIGGVLRLRRLLTENPEPPGA